MGIIPADATGNFPLNEGDAVCQTVTMEEHGENFLNGLLRVMEDQNVKDATLSLRAGLGASFVRDLKRSKAQSPRLDTAMRLAAALGMTVEDIIAAADGGAHPRTISIAGTVGAGAQVPVFDAYEKGGGPQVELPSGLPANGIVAVEVVGDSMEPVYFAKDLLFYTRHSDSGVPDDVIGHPCVAEDADGMGWVKQVKRGDAPGLFHLVSLNPGAQTMWNVPLKWAARIRLHWPADLARRR